MKSLSLRDNYSPMTIVALFTTTKVWTIDFSQRCKGGERIVFSTHYAETIEYPYAKALTLIRNSHYNKN